MNSVELVRLREEIAEIRRRLWDAKRTLGDASATIRAAAAAREGADRRGLERRRSYPAKLLAAAEREVTTSEQSVEKELAKRGELSEAFYAAERQIADAAITPNWRERRRGLTIDGRSSDSLLALRLRFEIDSKAAEKRVAAATRKLSKARQQLQTSEVLVGTWPTLIDLHLALRAIEQKIRRLERSEERKTPPKRLTKAQVVVLEKSAAKIPRLTSKASETDRNLAEVKAKLVAAATASGSARERRDHEVEVVAERLIAGHAGRSRVAQAIAARTRSLSPSTRFESIKKLVCDNDTAFAAVHRSSVSLRCAEAAEADLAATVVDLVAHHAEAARALDEAHQAREALEQAGVRVRPRVPKRVIYCWEDAEALALEFLRYLGAADAELSREGADGGIDVTSSKALAQVKAHLNPVALEDVQRHFGICAAERKSALFFAMKYSREAERWSDEHHMALYTFDRAGKVVPVSNAAAELDESGNFRRVAPHRRR